MSDGKSSMTRQLDISKGSKSESAIDHQTFLYDGNGLTDDTSLKLTVYSSKKLKKTRHKISSRKHKAISKQIPIIVVALILIFLPFGFYTLVTPNNQKTREIMIDNDFEEWSIEDMYTDTVLDQPNNPNIDLVRYNFKCTDKALVFYIEMQGNILNGVEMDKVHYPDSISILIDSDLNEQTGYRKLGIGAEYLLDIRGAAHTITNQGLYRFNKDIAKSQEDWSGWEYLSHLVIGLGVCRLEGEAFLPDSEPPSNFNIMIITKDHHGNRDISDEIVNPYWGILTAKVIAAPPPVINLDNNDNDNKEIFMSVDLQAIHVGNDEININGLDFECLGNVDADIIDEIHLIVHKSKPTITTDEIDQEAQEYTLTSSHLAREDKKITVLLEQPIIILNNEIVQMDIVLELSTKLKVEHGSCIGLKLTEVLTTGVSVTIDHLKQELTYLNVIPKDIKIDGAFADWGEIQKIQDEDTLRITNPDLDIQEFGLAKDDTKLDFYFKIDGNLLNAADLPITLGPVFELSTSEESNNLPNNDVLPKGQDTEIPEEIIPMDTLRIFFDIDNNESTGYKPHWLLLGADYMVEVSGRNGEIATRLMFKYENNFGTNSDKPWRATGTIQAAKDTAQLETAVPYHCLGIGTSDEIKVCYLLSNWDNTVVDTLENMESSLFTNSLEDNIDLEFDYKLNQESVFETSDDDSLQDAGNTRATISGNDYGGADLIPNDGDILNGAFTNVGRFEIRSGVTIYAGTGIELEVYANDIYINGTINADGTGSLGGVGPGGVGGGLGGGSGSPGGGGGGGAYGGNGGTGGGAIGGFGGIAFGKQNITVPSNENDISLGSGGGGGSSDKSTGGNGGGSIFLMADNNLLISGTVSANGFDGSSAKGSKNSGGGGGSGGGILLYLSSINNTLQITPTGTLGVNGGNGGDTSVAAAGGGGGGSGGRIKILYYNLNMSGTHIENGGIGGNYQTTGNGQPGNTGTYFQHQLQVDDNDTQDNDTQDNDTTVANIVINEIMFNPTNETREWVELHNLEDEEIDLAGWMLTDNDGNAFNLSGSGVIPAGGYLTCHFGQYGENSSSDVYCPIIHENLTLTMMLENNDDLSLINPNGSIIDYVAWGGDVGLDDDAAVAAGQWLEGDYVDTIAIQENQTIGRDMHSTDTNSSIDWTNEYGQAEPYGIHAVLPTPGEQNIDINIPEFQVLALPMMIIAVIFFTFNRFYSLRFKSRSIKDDNNKTRNRANGNNNEK